MRYIPTLFYFVCIFSVFVSVFFAFVVFVYILKFKVFVFEYCFLFFLGVCWGKCFSTLFIHF